MILTETQVWMLLTMENTPRALKTEWEPGARKLEEAGLLECDIGTYYPTEEGSKVVEDVYDTVLGAWLKMRDKPRQTAHYYFDGDHQSCCDWRRPRAEPPEIDITGKQCVKCTKMISREYVFKMASRNAAV